MTALTEENLDAAYAAGRAAWPVLAVERERFAAYLRERLPDPPTTEALASLCVDNLYLVSACLAGERAAIDAFERAHGEAIGQSVGKFDFSDAERQDLIQLLRIAFFVKKSLASYSGMGALRGWVRSTSTRAALDALRARKLRPDDEDDILGSLPASGDPEIDLLRERFAADFRAAFVETMKTLEAEHKTILAQHYVDELNIDALAFVLGCHRATAARRVAAARAALFEGTRQRLGAMLDLDNGAFESMMRAAQSRLHVSVFRLLKS